jgi:hypothetical protein
LKANIPSSERRTIVSDFNDQEEYLDKNKEPKEDDVQGHRLVDKPEFVDEPDVEGHMNDIVEVNEYQE